MLGKRQKELIAKYWAHPVSGYRNELVYGRYLNSRETGRGIPVMMRLVHVASGDVEASYEVARCEYEFSAEAKIVEIEAYFEVLEERWCGEGE